MENIKIILNASKLLPGVMPPQALKVTVDEDGLTHLIRINGPRIINIGEGPLEGVARTLLRVSTGALPEFEQSDMSIISNDERVILSTPGSGLQIGETYKKGIGVLDSNNTTTPKVSAPANKIPTNKTSKSWSTAPKGYAPR